MSGSFPSGHAGLAVVVFGGLAVVVHRMTTDPVARRTAVVMATVLAVGVAAGRLYQGMHDPTDIVAGWAYGATCLAAAVIASRGSAGGSRRKPSGEQRTPTGSPG